MKENNESKTSINLTNEKIITNEKEVSSSKVIIPVAADCGCNLGAIFSCVKYVSEYGPMYEGVLPIEQYQGWDQDIIDGYVDANGKKVICIMSANEGNLDSVQAYDSEALTAGAMQKTINSNGQGQFPALVAKFRDAEFALYEALFVNCGWTVEGKSNTEAIMYYSDKDITKGDNKTSIDLKNILRDDSIFNKTNHKKKDKYSSKPLAVIVRAIKHERFVRFQVRDFINQLNLVLKLKIKIGGKKFLIGDLVKSNLGQATVVDQYVNRPAYVSTDLQSAIEEYISLKKIVDKDPFLMGEYNEDYESGFIEIYGNKRRGTDMVKRFNKMKNKV
ncbi:hypothetical protein [Deefgea rivuli]|uniref:hypothetical protein n=1 Tax=Deefgea rivuli TaxID=400948 RepID=UPI0006884340|nr:hypothetical protein [Deefgea rivuli]